MYVSLSITTTFPPLSALVMAISFHFFNKFKVLRSDCERFDSDLHGVLNIFEIDDFVAAIYFSRFGGVWFDGGSK